MLLPGPVGNKKVFVRSSKSHIILVHFEGTVNLSESLLSRSLCEDLVPHKRMDIHVLYLRFKSKFDVGVSDDA